MSVLGRNISRNWAEREPPDQRQHPEAGVSWTVNAECSKAQADAVISDGLKRDGRVSAMTGTADSSKRSSRGRGKHVGYGEGREALLAAAVRVVARRGLRHLTYRSVAEEAGVTHGLVVHHFGSRDALIAEALSYAITMSLSTSRLEPGTGKLGDFVVGLADMVEGNPDLQAFQYELLLEARRRPELMPAVRTLYQQYYAATERELARILPEGASAALNLLVFSALDGLVMYQLTLGEPSETNAAVEELRSMLRLLAQSRADSPPDAGE